MNINALSHTHDPEESRLAAINLSGSDTQRVMHIIIDWAALTRPQHKAVFNVLKDLHADVIGRVRVEEGRDNTVLFAIATDLNRVMHAGNDDLVRREHRFERKSCDCGVCP